MEENAIRTLLAGFDLEPAEKSIAENIIRSYSHKIREREECEYLKLRLKKSQKVKRVLNRIEGEIKIKNKIFTSQAEDYNLFSALDEVLEKMLSEIVHAERTKRQ